MREDGYGQMAGLAIIRERMWQHHLGIVLQELMDKFPPIAVVF